MQQPQIQFLVLENHPLLHKGRMTARPRRVGMLRSGQIQTALIELVPTRHAVQQRYLE